ncbi:hypothetical protein EGT74_23505 [Chitinophaga lutea]|uniref:Uncharacterized protein n=1 Tax=Chitinophaga lutea TaxID=2488634 RepID=A0A3N4PD54_9BACT|nr:hypothetical protein [Chitinophaga lutea]RPE05358.1 hypothetical protein EGT74_23505 [Chitinophaga lutea]
MEAAHVQKLSRGKIDAALTTNIAVAKALGISYTQLAAYFDGVTQQDIDEYLAELEKLKKAAAKKKK